ncbi:glyoxylase-like metal-dependent hydrolase (beta-lactamase superfamily II) [Mycobacterium frederiksbergense]|uniref:Glyoxylase-like metal-dependent hydrolase (Beta-lactamase superfamily II) n=1 Tax=Mycolicibacterium frederiksbergense TaxID=117567 RepID=A0ABT6KXE6_9MYCO|nr:MBL fold metallo-hydrolase [Mycolicibacterium frederiksbergense]MDH6194650.1 glyoxylase-like metal-dependent hydrolase (beta-lactamase superfamily II) [Mycolicibacterium frederiksbergense]
MQKWTIGGLTIHAVLETVVPTRADRLFRGLPSELPRWLHPYYVDDAGNLLVTIQSFFIESGDQLVVVDCCFGEGHDLPYQIPIDPDQYRRSLAAAGFTPGDVTTVVCTHLHLDHAGRNTTLRDGAWIPTYPNATYLLTTDEYAAWQVSTAPNRAAAECVEPLVAHDVLRLTEMDHAITDEIRLIATPGHTPGHAAVRIESGGTVAVISGDVIHHPIQISHPDVQGLPDEDPAAAAATRARLLQRVVDEQAILFGTHFAAPTAGTVRSDNGTLRWVPV